MLLKLCDVTLVAGQVRIPAHRLVLCAASDYFAAMFNSGLSETNLGEVVLKDVDPDALAVLIRYVYSGDRMFLRLDLLKYYFSFVFLLSRPASCGFSVI